MSRNSLKIVWISLVVLLVIAIFVKGPGYDNHYYVLISAASFLFGILAAFSISANHSKLTQINEVLKEDEGILLFIYNVSHPFDEETRRDIKKLIDNYLIDQIDYFLFDFKYSSKSFKKLFKYVANLTTKNGRQGTAYSNMMDQLADSWKNRKTVESLVQQRLSRFEWVSLLTLLGVFLFFIFYMNDGSLVSVITSVCLSMAAIIVVLVLRDLDNLTWKEDSWIWEPLENLFSELDLPPYYPIDVLKAERAKVDPGTLVRIAEYPNRYPDMSGKVIKETTV